MYNYIQFYYVRISISISVLNQSLNTIEYITSSIGTQPVLLNARLSAWSIELYTGHTSTSQISGIEFAFDNEGKCFNQNLSLN